MAARQSVIGGMHEMISVDINARASNPRALDTDTADVTPIAIALAPEVLPSRSGAVITGM